MDTAMSGMIRQISEAFANDPRTRKAVIDIGFNQGIVTLTGFVKTVAEVQAAEEIARAQDGVVSVINELRVAA